MDKAATESNENSTIRVTTGARLHFGLFDVKAPYGGVGMMVDHPRTIVTVSAANRFVTHPCQLERIVQIAHRIAARLPSSLTDHGLPRCQVTIEAAADSHCGLGSGTQLSLAAATAMCEFFSLNLSRYELVHEIAARGRRSSVGSIGFFVGGLIAEDGSEHHLVEQLSPTVPGSVIAEDVSEHRSERCSSWQRTTLPQDWRVVIACPNVDTEVVYGDAEGAAFAKLGAASAEYRASLVEESDKLMGSATLGNFDLFCSSVAEFNRLSGALFASHQGGCYNGDSVQQLVTRIQNFGNDIGGVGQSSWGPSVFGFCRNEMIAKQVCESLDGLACRIVKPQFSGYSLERNPSTSCK